MARGNHLAVAQVGMKFVLTAYGMEFGTPATRKWFESKVLEQVPSHKYIAKIAWVNKGWVTEVVE